MSAFLRLSPRFTALIVTAWCVCAINARAAINLSSGNSTVTLDPSTQMGMNSWSVDGQSQLYQQWFWYWTPSMTSEKSIDTIGVPVINVNSPSQAISTYTGSGFTLSVIYDLQGGAAGSGQSTINETITINNTTASPLTFRFFQYSDYNLGGVDQDVVQIQPGFGYALVTSGALSLGEAVVSPSANSGEVAPFDVTLQKLNNGSIDTLNGTLGPSTPGDNTFAFQWDFTIAPNGSQIISKVKSLQVQVVPEPTSAVLGLLGIGVLFGRRFMKK